MHEVSRRSLLRSSTVLAATAAAQAVEDEAHAAAPVPTGAGSTTATPAAYLFLNADEVAFVEAAIARLIPNEPEWPGALEADVAVYIDRQLDGAYGQGARFYRQGPFRPGLPGQGYQLAYTPAELFRAGVRRLAEELPKRMAGPPFRERPPEEQDRVLAALEAGELDLAPVPARAFFGLLLDLTAEGYFADPVYGGNKDMVSWRMIGFPGAYAAWALAVEDHGAKIDMPPVSLATHGRAAEAAHHGHGGGSGGGAAPKAE